MSVFKIKSVTANSNSSLQLIIEGNTIQDHIYFNNLTKKKQLILLFLTCRLLGNLEESALVNQRTLAKKLKSHYNSINTHIQKLETEEKINSKRIKNHLEIKLNLSNFSNIELLLLVSREFSQYLNERINQSISISNEKVIEKRENSSYEDKLLEKQINYLTEHKKELSQKLARDLVNSFSEANNQAVAVLDKYDYNILIVELLENISSDLPEFFISKLPTKLKETRYQLRGKLNKL